MNNMSNTRSLPENIYSRLIDAALCSEFHRQQHGAVVLDDRNRIISVGWNKRKTHPKQKAHAIKAGQPAKEFLHAEIDALIFLPGRDTAYSIVVGRLNKRGLLTYSKPCPVCMRAIRESGCKWLYYSDRSGELNREEIV